MNLPGFQQVLFAALILVGAWIVSTLAVAILKRTRVLTSKTETTLDDVLVHLLSRPIHIGFQLIGLVVALEYLFPNLTYQRFGYKEFSFILLSLWLAYALSRIVRGLMNWKAAEVGSDGSERVKRGTFGFLNTIVSVIFWALAIAFILDQVGVDITAMLAGLGIAGIAVALALQNTLSGLFAAVGLALDQPIRQGDYVKLEDGTEGFVEDISMRSTRIRTFSKSLVIVPNSKITSMVIENSYLPEQKIVVKIPVGVAYGTDLDKAEAVAVQVAKKVLDLHAAGEDAEPFVRYGNFGDSSIDMTVFLNVKQFLDQFVVKHDFIKVLSVAFEKEGIEIPYPQMDVRVKK